MFITLYNVIRATVVAVEQIAVDYESVGGPIKRAAAVDFIITELAAHGVKHELINPDNVGFIVDATVAEFNHQYGHGWLKDVGDFIGKIFKFIGHVLWL
jgi:hypothetical protein